MHEVKHVFQIFAGLYSVFSFPLTWSLYTRQLPYWSEMLEILFGYGEAFICLNSLTDLPYSTWAYNFIMSVFSIFKVNSTFLQISSNSYKLATFSDKVFIQ